MLWHIVFWFLYPFFPLVLIFSFFKVLNMAEIFIMQLICRDDFIIQPDMRQDLIRVFLSCEKIDVFRIHAKHSYDIVLDDSRVQNGVWKISNRMFCKVFQPLCNLWILTEFQSQLLETLSCFALIPNICKVFQIFFNIF